MNPATAGLGALPQSNTQPGNMPTGMPPQNMSATMALAKKMSDMQLADVLAGKNMDVPQFVAMTEAMGRKQLRTAMQGMTAMTTAKQPTEREKLLSEMMPRQAQPSMMSVPPQGAAPQGAAPQGAAPQGAGLDQLPADNMQGLGHANGGIIAFSGKEGKQEVEDPDNPNYVSPGRMWKGIKDWLISNPEEVRNNGKTSAYEYPALGNVVPHPIPLTSINNLPQSITAFPKDKFPAGAIDASTLSSPRSSIMMPPLEGVGTGTLSSKPNATTLKTNNELGGAGIGGPGGGGPGGGGPGGGLSQTDLASFAQKQADLLRPKERDADYYAALTRPIDDIANQVASGKEQAKGEFLMNLGAGLLSKPNLAMGLSEGVNRGLPGLAASRKESNALLKDQRDYQFNIAKAKEARDQGNEMLALNYMKLAEESKYHEDYVKALMARASGADKLTQQLNIAAARLTQSDWEKHEKTLGFSAKKITPEQKQAFMQESYFRNLTMLQGNPPPAAAEPELFEKPGGPILTRP